MRIQKATLLFLIKDNKILLGHKKRGFGEGFWNGAGGKVEEGETPKQAAIREAQEEIKVLPKNPQKVADIDFFIPATDDQGPWIQRTFVYKTSEWVREPQETEEMNPKWFKFSEIPYNQMWSDDQIWLPKVLEGQKIKAKFWFDNNLQVTKYTLTPSDI